MLKTLLVQDAKKLMKNKYALSFLIVLTIISLFVLLAYADLMIDHHKFILHTRYQILYVELFMFTLISIFTIIGLMILQHITTIDSSDITKDIPTYKVYKAKVLINHLFINLVSILASLVPLFFVRNIESIIDIILIRIYYIVLIDTMIRFVLTLEQNRTVLSSLSLTVMIYISFYAPLLVILSNFVTNMYIVYGVVFFVILLFKLYIFVFWRKEKREEIDHNNVASE